MNRTQNAVRNISWGFFQKVVTLLLPFLARTVLIRKLGAEYLGLSSLFTSILGLLSLAELGVSNAIISAMYKPIADNDTDTICALMAFFRKAYYAIGTIIIIVGIGIIPFLDKLINGDVPPDINIYILYCLYLGNTALSYFLFAYKNCLFIAHQRNDISSKVQTACLCFQNAIQISLVLCFENYYCYAIVIPIVTIATNLITAYLAQKEYPQYINCGLLDKTTKAAVKQRVMGLMLGRISATIRSSIDSLFVSAFLGLSLVAIYSNYFYVATAVAGIIQTLEAALVAGVGNSIVTDTIEKNHHDFMKFTFMLQWIVGWSSICVLCMEQPFMKIWVGEELMLNDSMAVLCSLYLFVCCICLIRSIYTQALGMWWALRYLSIIDILANFFLNYFLGKNFGVYGILGATIIDIAFVSLPWTTYFLFRDYFGKKLYWGYMGQYIKYFFVAIIAGGSTYLICNQIPIDSNVLKLVINGMICLVVPNAIYLIIFAKTKYFKESIQLMKSKFRR